MTRDRIASLSLKESRYKYRTGLNGESDVQYKLLLRCSP